MTPDSAVGYRPWTQRMGHLAALLLLLAGCAAPKPAEVARQPSTTPTPAPLLVDLQAYAVKPGVGAQCVPYARSRSGIGIRGDAYTWWDSAAGQFARGNIPAPGAVLVLRKTDRLSRGHVAVVTRVTTPREIRVDHANWQPGALITGMAAIDVSPANDWSHVRFWNKDTRKWGRIYPAAGFIYNLPDGAPLPAIKTAVSGAGNPPQQQPTP
jgi:surface antigen